MKFNFHVYITPPRRRAAPLIYRRPTNPNVAIILQNTWRPSPRLVSSFLAVTKKIVVFWDLTSRSLVPPFPRYLLSQSSGQCTQEWCKELEVGRCQLQDNFRLSPGDTEMIHGVPVTTSGKLVLILIWDLQNASLNTGTWYTPQIITRARGMTQCWSRNLYLRVSLFGSEVLAFYGTENNFGTKRRSVTKLKASTTTDIQHSSTALLWHCLAEPRIIRCYARDISFKSTDPYRLN
jgi:hypothetical protein